jgi:integrase
MVWTGEQTGEFLDRAESHRLYALYHLIAHTGLRRGEACGAEVDSLDLDAAELLISASLIQLGWGTATPRWSASLPARPRRRRPQ